MPTRSAQHTHRSHWYKGRPAQWRAPFADTPDEYYAGLADGFASATGARVFNEPNRNRLAYRRGWATAMANHAPRRGRKLPKDKPDDRFERDAGGKLKLASNNTPIPRLCAWTRKNDDRIRAALAAGKMGKVEMVFDASTYQPQQKETDTMPKNARTQPSAPRAIATPAPRGVTGSLGAKSPIQYAPPVATIADDIAAKRSAAARKAHETRKANGWVHPRSNGQPRASAAPVEPIKRASLADLAQGIAPDTVKATPKPTPRAGKILGDILMPVLTGKPKKAAPNKPAAKPPAKKVRPAKKAAPKNTTKKPVKKAAAPRGR